MDAKPEAPERNSEPEQSWRRWIYVLVLNFILPGLGFVFLGWYWLGGLVLFSLFVPEILSWYIFEQGQTIYGAPAGLGNAWVITMAICIALTLMSLLISVLFGRTRRRPRVAPGWVYGVVAALGFGGFMVSPGTTALDADSDGTFEVFHLPARSMVPTLWPDDWVLASAYAPGDVLRAGDIVAYHLANDPVIVMGRIVGQAGDKVKYDGGWLILNGQAVARTAYGEIPYEGSAIAKAPKQMVRYFETLPGGIQYEIAELTDDAFLDTTREFVVPEGHVFVLGDNRDNSMDSRSSQRGYVPIENITGLIWLRFWSAEEGQQFNRLRPEVRENP